MNSFQAVCLFWWLVLGATGHACRCASLYRVYPWINRFDVVAWVLLAPMMTAMGLFALGFAVCFEPGKEN